MTDLRVAALRRVSPRDAGIAFGTGYLVADRLVLTAAHVAGVVGESLEVRLGGQLVTGTVIWRASGADDASSRPDAALIEIDEGTYPTADLPPVRWGWIVGRGPAVGCTATGYPDALVAPDGRADGPDLDPRGTPPDPGTPRVPDPLQRAGHINRGSNGLPNIETQPSRNVADLRSVHRKPVVAGMISEYHHAA